MRKHLTEPFVKTQKHREKKNQENGNSTETKGKITNEKFSERNETTTYLSKTVEAIKQWKN